MRLREAGAGLPRGRRTARFCRLLLQAAENTHGDEDMPNAVTREIKGGVKLAKVDLLWIVIGALVPIALAILNYSHTPSSSSQLLVTAALILGSFSLITTRMRAIERSLDGFQKESLHQDSAATEVLAAALSGGDMKSCRRLFSVFNAVLGCSNPLMKALAMSQMNGLAEFLEKFDKGLPFFPENEIITIDKHYTSFMRRMGKNGGYTATTFVQFWHEQDEEILGDFFHNNEMAANDGVSIRRIFLIIASEEGDPVGIGVLRRHLAISGGKYQNGGSIETKVLVAETFNRDQDDFGIYILHGHPMAIAIAKFERTTNRLRGNEVSFDEDFMMKKLNLFEARWLKACAVEVYLAGLSASLPASKLEVNIE